ncbi:hypothetical protein C2845_PM16G04160 [Panicum miliaceum]|uniref:Uncharacterized protein n=1 Tax=Panicum miliaceum TaxID=4540 RepID=A0A3L6PU57_PANMI|nr:hypothetical protein C2845_PM16G04160 [Panicum miliaceum]
MDSYGAFSAPVHDPKQFGASILHALFLPILAIHSEERRFQRYHEKKYVNPNMSILHFVRQYQKIHDKCLIVQDRQDFKTDDMERRRWSKYAIEKHASAAYTKNLFYRFLKEFEKTVEYDVKPEGQFQFWLVPNNKYVYGFGKRTYLLMALEATNLIEMA